MSPTNMTKVPYQGSWIWVNPDAHHKGEVAYSAANYDETGALVPTGPVYATMQDAMDLVDRSVPFVCYSPFVFDGEGNWVAKTESRLSDVDAAGAAFWHRPI